MSRSYLKNHIITVKADSKYFKQKANKKVRSSEVDDGMFYKRLYDSYTICDYKSKLFKHREMFSDIEYKKYISK